MPKFEAFNKIAELFADDWSGDECECIDMIMEILAYENCSKNTRKVTK